MNAPNLIENETEKVNVCTSNITPHIILSAEGLKSPIHMIIDTGAGSNLIKQQAVKTNVKINKFECLELTGINEHDQYFRLPTMKKFRCTGCTYRNNSSGKRRGKSYTSVRGR